MATGSVGLGTNQGLQALGIEDTVEPDVQLGYRRGFNALRRPRGQGIEAPFEQALKIFCLALSLALDLALDLALGKDRLIRLR